MFYAPGAKSQPTVDQTLPSTYVPSGKAMFQLYCANCHGADAKGNGPLAPALKTPPPNLTTLAKRHAGKFPYDYVSRMLQFGTTARAHGSSDNARVGPDLPVFRQEKPAGREAAHRQSLSNYLASVQQQ